MDVGAAVKAEAGSGLAVRDWNVAAAVAARADRGTGLEPGSGPGCLGHWLEWADRGGGLHPEAGQPTGGSGGSWDSAGQVNPSVA